MILKKSELLLPAGWLDKMRAAFDFGADAIYAGQARALGQKFFVTSNLLPHNDKVRTYLSDIEPVIDMRPDALITADPGLIMMVREGMDKGNFADVPTLDQMQNLEGDAITVASGSPLPA